MTKRKIIIIICVVIFLITGGIFSSSYPLKVMQIKSIGAALKPSKVIEPFSVNYYLQNDPEWSGDKLGFSNSSMGSAGCLVASITTALNYFGIDYDPGEVNKIFKENNVYNENGQVIWMNIKDAIDGVDYKYDRIFNSKTIEDLLGQNLIPIIEVKYKGFGVNHWVAVIGTDGEDFLVMDSLNGNKMPLKLSEHGGRAFAYRVLVKT